MKMAHNIAVLLISFIISIVAEGIISGLIFAIQRNLFTGSILAYPIVFIATFILIYQTYTDKDAKNTSTYSYEVSHTDRGVGQNQDGPTEYRSSAQHIRKTKKRIMGESLTLSLILPFLAMLLLDISTKKLSFLAIICLLIIASTQLMVAYQFYAHLLKTAKERKIIFSGGLLHFFDTADDGNAIELTNLSSIKIRQNDISKEITQIQLLTNGTSRKGIVIEGYNDMNILFQKLTGRSPHDMKPIIPPKRTERPATVLN